MATIRFTANLQRHLDCPPRQVAAATLREALNRVFADNPRLRHYILDEQDRLRKHVALFVDGQQLKNKGNLNIAIGSATEIDVIQALSGG